MKNLDFEKIINEYLAFRSTKDIAKKFNITQDDVKLLIRNCLPPGFYLRIARKIGAKSVHNKRINNLDYKINYSNKMRESVSTSLNSKMKDKEFRSKWLIKAKKASKIGNEKIKELLIFDPNFSIKWSMRCRDAGKKSLRNKSGIHDPKIQPMRKIWSIKGLKNTGKRIRGPNGEKMYNSLEVRVAEILNKFKLDYEYGKIVNADNVNKFYSLDFVISNKIVIEVTYWDNVREKAKKLFSKFKTLKNQGDFDEYLLITRRTMIDSYKRLLPHHIIVLTPEELECFIAGKAG